MSYGEPPLLEECVQSKAVVPATLEMCSDPELQRRELPVMHLFGKRLPDWAKARQVVRTLQSEGGNRFARVSGLGTVVVGSDGWRVIK